VHYVFVFHLQADFADKDIMKEHILVVRLLVLGEGKENRAQTN